MIHIEMHFYATPITDGTIHVQNMVMGRPGQHHIHTKESFERWKKNIDEEYLHMTKEKPQCDCGLKGPGWVREYDGRVWFNDRFLNNSPEGN